MLGIRHTVFIQLYQYPLTHRQLKHQIGGVIVVNQCGEFNLLVFIGVQQQIGLIKPEPGHQRQSEVVNAPCVVHDEQHQRIAIHERRRFTGSFNATLFNKHRPGFRVRPAPGICFLYGGAECVYLQHLWLLSGVLAQTVPLADRRFVSIAGIKRIHQPVAEYRHRAPSHWLIQRRAWRLFGQALRDGFTDQLNDRRGRCVFAGCG